jgi:hypothetical protein
VPTVLPEHVRNLVLHRQEDPARVGVHHVVPLLDRDVVQRRVDSHARVVERDIQTSIALHRAIHELLHGRGHAHIGLDVCRLTSRRADTPLDVASQVRAPSTERHLRSGRGERPRGRLPDSRGRAGDQHDLAGEPAAFTSHSRTGQGPEPDRGCGATQNGPATCSTHQTHSSKSNLVLLLGCPRSRARVNLCLRVLSARLAPGLVAVAPRSGLWCWRPVWPSSRPSAFTR